MARSEGVGNLSLRIAAGAAGIIIIVATLFLGGLPFALALIIVAGLALNEFYSLFREHHFRPNEVLGIVAGAAFPLAALTYGRTGMTAILFLATTATLIWYLAFPKTGLADMSITVFGSVYVGFLLSYLILIRGLGNGVWLVLLVLVATWINDIVAYAVGVTLGRTKLAPSISPGKTWEGTIAGIAAATLVLGAMTFITYLDTVERTILGGVVGLAAIAGDLAESRLKRELGVKDAGKLIPGHGGFLDRFDSLLFVSGASYYLLTALFKLR